MMENACMVQKQMKTNADMVQKQMKTEGVSSG